MNVGLNGTVDGVIVVVICLFVSPVDKYNCVEGATDNETCCCVISVNVPYHVGSYGSYSAWAVQSPLREVAVSNVPTS